MNATMPLEKIKHYPVMLDQVLSIISPQHGGTFIDCTFGGGSYSKAILKFPNTKVYAIDRDKLISEKAENLKEKFPKRFCFFQNKFSNLNKIIKSELEPKAIIFDLGTSSFQLSDQKRGFSFNSKNVLSMEMGINNFSAYDVVNSLDQQKLASIIKILGDEKEGKIIAKSIVKHRMKKPIRTCEELNAIVRSAKKKFNHKKNPATKTFQAIRIFVNQELTELVSGLIAASKLLKNNGILLVVSFHSLEDKIVKNFFKLYSSFNQNPSRYLPEKKNKKNLFKLFSKKVQTPSQEEISENLGSRSAKLRYAIRSDSKFIYPEEIKKKFGYYFQLEETRI